MFAPEAREFHRSLRGVPVDAPVEDGAGDDEEAKEEDLDDEAGDNDFFAVVDGRESAAGHDAAA